MNTITNTFNDIRGHYIFKNNRANTVMTGLAILLSVGISLVFLPSLCFFVAFSKTIMYSHLTKTRCTDRVTGKDIKKSDELANSWLIYCFVTVAYWLMNSVLGGIFLVVARLVMLLVVADMSFLKDSEDTTIPVVMFNMVDRVVDRYRTGKVATYVSGSFEYFSKVTYPKKRMAMYRYVMTYLSNKMYKTATKQSTHVDLNKSMMECESPRSPQKHTLPIRVIQSATEAQDKLHNNEMMDNMLSDILDRLDTNHNVDVSDQNNVTTSPVSATHKSYKTKNKSKVRKVRKDRSRDRSEDRSTAKHAMPEVTHAETHAETHEETHAETLTKILDETPETTHNEMHEDTLSKILDENYSDDQYSDQDSGQDNGHDDKQDNEHYDKQDNEHYDKQNDEQDGEQDDKQSMDDSIYDKTLLDLGESHLFTDSDRSLDED
jgi:hypothetical protein